MKITHSMFVMFVGSFIVQYLLMPLFMVNKISYITNNIGKAYLSAIMGIYMVLIEVIMHDHHYGVFSLNFYVALFLILAMFTYLYRKQIAIDDKQYLEGMIEHHSMAVFTSEKILEKTDDYHVAKLAKNIISQQKEELQTMTQLVKMKIKKNSE